MKAVKLATASVFSALALSSVVSLHPEAPPASAARPPERATTSLRGKPFSPSLDREVAQAQAVRSTLGFPADEGTTRVRLAKRGPDARPERDLFLDDGERREFSRRLDVQEKVGKAARRLKSSKRDVVAELFIDHGEGGTVNLWATDPSAVDVPALEAEVGAPVLVTRVERSHRRLAAAFERLSQPDALGLPGFCGVSEDNEKNIVMADACDPAAVDRVVAFVRANGLQDDVTVRVGQVRPAANLTAGRSLGACTAGPQVYRDSIYGRAYYTLTAAHCPNNLYFEGRALPLVGERAVSGYGAAYADVQIHYTGGSRGDVTYANGAVISGVVAEVAPDGQWDNVGDAACKSGQTTGFTCGIITNTRRNYWLRGENIWYLNGRVTTNGSRTVCEPGDSGGPVFVQTVYGAAVQGVVSGTPDENANSCIYAPMVEIHRALDAIGAPFTLQRSVD